MFTAQVDRVVVFARVPQGAARFYLEDETRGKPPLGEDVGIERRVAQVLLGALDEAQLCTMVPRCLVMKNEGRFVKYRLFDLSVGPDGKMQYHPTCLTEPNRRV